MLLAAEAIGVAQTIKLEPLGAWPGWDTDPAQIVVFADSQHGWAHSYSALRTTSDGGATWKRVTPPGLDRDTQLIQAELLSATRGWVLLFGKAARLLYTKDAGETWSGWALPQLNEHQDLVRAAWLLDDGRTGWLKVGTMPSGSNEFEAQTIFRTTDSGQHWVRQLRVRPSYSAKDRQPPRPIYFVDGTHGLAETLTGYFFTRDAGGTWAKPIFRGTLTPDESSDDDDAGSYFLNAETGWMLGSNGDFWRTLDGGQIWTLLKRPGTIWPRQARGCSSNFGIYFDSEQHGLVLGADCTLHETFDGGREWSPIQSDHILFCLTCARNGGCWAGAVDSGKLYRLGLRSPQAASGPRR